jgi:hypothetical protein
MILGSTACDTMLTIGNNEFSNRTVYGIESERLRYIWAGYFLFVMLSSLIGDTTILIASIKYKALKLHKAIVVIIQHIAVCDLMMSTFYVLPKCAYLIANGSMLGNFMCYLYVYIGYYLNLASPYLVCNMTVSKLLLLKYPLRFGTTTLKKAHLSCVACWLAALILPGIFLIVDCDDITFSYRGYLCVYGFSSDIWHSLRPLFAALNGIIPTSLVVATTIYLLILAKQVARRGRESLKWQGIMTTLLTATVYCISTLPYAAYSLGKSFIGADYRKKNFFFIYHYRIALSFVSLNTLSNFYIYCLTVSSFRAFVWSKMQPMYRFLSNITTSNYHGENQTHELGKIFAILFKILKCYLSYIISAHFGRGESTLKK